MEEVTNTKAIMLLYDFLGHRVHCIIQKKFMTNTYNILLARPKYFEDDVKIFKISSMLTKNTQHYIS